MFRPWSFFHLNLFYLALDLLVAAALSAALTHIARRHGGHAQSIRWIQQAGYFEMVNALRNSGSWGEWRPFFGLLATLAGSLALVGILVGSKTFAEIATQEGIVRQEVVASRQFVVFDIFTSIQTWYVPVGHETRMEDALDVALNSTKSIPRPDPTKRYKPRPSKYEVVCDQFDLRTHLEDPFLVPNNGCATVLFNSTSSINPDLTRSYIIQKSKGRAKVVMHGKVDPSFDRINSTVLDINVFSRVTHLGQKCLTYNYNFMCLFDSGEAAILSSTVIRFLAPEHQQFLPIATSIFGSQDELVAGLQDSLNNGTLRNLPADIREQVLVMEVKIAGSEATALICTISRWRKTEVPHITCAYTITNVLVVKFPPMNPDIAALLTNKGLNPMITNLTNAMLLYHLPMVSEKKPSFTFPKILNASSEAAHYFAHLGHNFVMDWDGSMLYVTFDATEIVKGYEIPAWLFYSMIGVMVTCVVFWGVTEVLVEDRYRDSLYFAVSKDLTAGQADVSPRLHRFNPDTLEFEGRRIVSTKGAQALEEEEEKEEAKTPYQQLTARSHDPLLARAKASAL
ncbi:hypothetical protein BGZ95_011320 [Linnemannia exigua]|uniref:Transmembrane protein n=1 Tax=Linnemannia exigua TaxID=604196 RepID=A0AAD4DK66_9FUNG|nr:hypothetical protein BGZ95_011320 [Linnemannia exigua]